VLSRKATSANRPTTRHDSAIPQDIIDRDDHQNRLNLLLGTFGAIPFSSWSLGAPGAIYITSSVGSFSRSVRSPTYEHTLAVFPRGSSMRGGFVSQKRCVRHKWLALKVFELMITLQFSPKSTCSLDWPRGFRWSLRMTRLVWADPCRESQSYLTKLSPPFTRRSIRGYADSYPGCPRLAHCPE
jgi:hypothetical protein